VNIKSSAPIALFVYNRPDHTKRTVEALKKNNLACESDLIIYSDGPKLEKNFDDVNKVRKYIREIDGFRTVSIIQRESNLGLAQSIIDGVTKILAKYGCIIVLEDDLITAPYFLSYMNEALEKFAADDRVISIHGYVYPVKETIPEAFFLPGADCWGWATWKRGWDYFNPDGEYLLDELRRRKLTKRFDYNGSFPYTKMLKDLLIGKNNSWAIRWYASAFLAGKLTLYPGRSLVHNIGNDNSGTHCVDDHIYDAALSSTPINLEHVSVTSSPEDRAVFEAFFLQTQGRLINKLWRRIKHVFTTVTI